MIPARLAFRTAVGPPLWTTSPRDSPSIFRQFRPRTAGFRSDDPLPAFARSHGLQAPFESRKVARQPLLPRVLVRHWARECGPSRHPLARVVAVDSGLFWLRSASVGGYSAVRLRAEIGTDSAWRTGRTRGDPWRDVWDARIRRPPRRTGIVSGNACPSRPRLGPDRSCSFATLRPSISIGAPAAHLLDEIELRQ